MEVNNWKVLMSRKIMVLLACFLFMTSYIIHPVQQALAEPFYDGTSALEQKKALDYINQLREHMGIGKVTLDPYLVKALSIMLGMRMSTIRSNQRVIFL